MGKIVTILFVLLVWMGQIQGQQLMLPIGHLQPVTDANFSHDGKLVVTTSIDNTAKIWERYTGKVIASVALSSPSRAVFDNNDSLVLLSNPNTEPLYGGYAICRWNFRTGQLAYVESAVVSDNFEYYVEEHSSAVADSVAIKEVQILHAGSGKPYKSFPMGEKPIEKAYFSQGSKYLVTCSFRPNREYYHNSREIQVFDLATGERVCRTSFSDSVPLVNMKISPDGRYVIMYNDFGYRSLLDLNGGVWKHSFEEVHTGGYPPIEIRFSPDGKSYLRSEIYNRNSTTNQNRTYREREKWEEKVIKELYNLTDSIAKKFVFALEIYSTEDGKSLGIIDAHKRPLRGASYSADGTYIQTYSIDGTVKRWDVQSGELIHTYVCHDEQINNVSESPDGLSIITSSDDLFVRIWEVSTGISTGVLRGYTAENNMKFAKFAPDGILAITSSGKVWDTKQGRLLGTLEKCRDEAFRILFNDAGDKVFLAFPDGYAGIWDIFTRRRIAHLEFHNDENVEEFVFHQNGKYLISRSSYKAIHLWNLETGQVSKKMQFWADSEKDEFHLSPLGRYILEISTNSPLRLFDAITGKLMKVLSIPPGSNSRQKYFRPQFSVDEKFLFLKLDHSWIKYDIKSGSSYLFDNGNWFVITSLSSNIYLSMSKEKGITVRKMATNEVVSHLKGSIASYSDYSNYSITMDEKRILGVSGTCSVWDIESGNLIGEIIEPDSISQFRWGSFSRDGEFVILHRVREGEIETWAYLENQIISSFKIKPETELVDVGGIDNTMLLVNKSMVTIRNASDSNKKFNLLAIDSKDYLSLDDDGRFDGTESARRLLYYTCNWKSVDLEQIKELSWEPGLVSKINGVSVEPITAKRIDQINICDYIPEVEDIGYLDSTYQYRISPLGGGIGEVNLFVNGKLLKTYSPDELELRNGHYFLSVRQADVEDFFGGNANNQVVVKATTRDGSMTSRGSIIKGFSKKKGGIPSIYIVSIGVSKYKGEKLQLRYASKDAANFSSAVTNAARKFLNTDGKEHVYSYNFNTDLHGNAWPDKPSIKRIMDSISLRATADDILLLFFAGHGVVRKHEKILYLLTAEAASLDQVESISWEISINTEELNEWMRKIKANKQVLILDACNSGQAVKNAEERVTKRGISPDQQRALDNLRGKTATYILAASASDQSAYETSQYEQGLLTYSLLSGIKLGNGLKDSKFLDINRWFTTASSDVQLLAKDIGGRQDPQIIGSGSFDIGLVDKEVTDAIHLSLKKKIFRRSTLVMNEDLLNDDLDLSEMLDQQLNELSISAKGSIITFIPENKMDEVYSIRGKYKKVGKILQVDVSLFMGKKGRVAQFKVEGDPNNLVSLVKAIIFKAMRQLK